MPRVPDRLRRWAHVLLRELGVLALAYRDPRTPLGPRLLAGAVLAYALSPLDLIPDPIPALGLLDDLLLVPAGIALSLRLLPTEVLEDARRTIADKPLVALRRSLGRRGSVAIVVLWLASALAVVTWALPANVHRLPR